MAIITHLISGYARPIAHSNRYMAECGLIVDGARHAKDGQPTCPDCARIAAEDAETASLLNQVQTMSPQERTEHFSGAPVKGPRR